MESSTTPQPPTYIDVTYIPGVTVYGTLAARLQWSADNRLSLTAVEGTAEAPVYKELFNVPVGEIVSVRSMLDEIKIVTKQGKFRISVSHSSTPVIAAGGAVGIAAAYGMYKKTGADKWIARFREHGVSVRRIGYGAIVGIALGVSALLIAGIAIAVIIAG